MFFDGQPVKQDIMLRTKSQALSDETHVCQDVVTVDVGGARGRGVQTCQHWYGCCFSSAIVAKQSSDLTSENVQGKSVYSHFGTGGALRIQGIRIWITLPALIPSPWPFLWKALDCRLIQDITWPRGDTKFLFECWRDISQVSAANEVNIFQHEKRNFVSPSDHVMFFLLYKYHLYKHHSEMCLVWQRRESLCNHNNGDLFTCEDNMIWSFRAKDFLTFIPESH